MKILRTDDDQLRREIAEEYKKLYYKIYGKRKPHTLSSMELDNITTEASKRVQDRRRGRLVE